MSDQWYELRVVGSAGTKAADMDHGLALDGQGRLCAISTGKAKRFSTEAEANDFLANLTLPRNYNFEAVLIRN